MTVYQGICKNGPMNGQVKVHTSRLFVPPAQTAGHYVFIAARGPIPGEWRWLEKRKPNG